MPQAIPAVIGAGVSLFGANQQAHAAKSAAKAATPVPYSVNGPAGTFGVDRQNQLINMQLDPNNPFAAMFQQMGLGSFQNAQNMGGQFLNGANSEVKNAYSRMFGQGLTSEIQNQLGLLRSAAAPEEQRQRLGLDDTLFSRGQMGTSGGAERYRAQDEAMNAADLQRQLAAVGLGQQNAQNRFQAAIGATNQGLNAQNQQFQMGQGAFGGLNQLFQQLIQQANVGTGAGSGTPQGAAVYAAQQSGAPYQTAFNFLNQAGAFNPGAWGGGGGYSGVPMVTQPGGPINVGAPDPSSWMPSGNFGL